MKTILCIVLLSITNLAFSQTENQVGKWGIKAAVGTDVYRWEERQPVRWEVTIAGGKQVSENLFLGLETGLLEYRERNTINFFYGSSSPNSYRAIFAGPKAMLYLVSPVVISGSLGMGRAQRDIGDYFNDTGFYGTANLRVGVYLLKTVYGRNSWLIPAIQYRADYFGVEEPGTEVFPKVSKHRNTLFFTMEFGFGFGKAKN